MKEEILSDFTAKWCKDILDSTDLVPLKSVGRLSPPPWDPVLTNTLFNETLRTETTIRAWVALTSPETRPGYVSPEFVVLLSLGMGVGGHHGQAHAAFSAAILDHVMGMCASMTLGRAASIVKSWQKFKKSIELPGIIVCRAVATRADDRSISVNGTIEDGSGDAYCEAGAVYISHKQQSGAKI